MFDGERKCMQYLKADSELGYIDDYTEIELEKLQNLRNSIKCFTFGDYDETGNYIIEDEVVDDLIAIEKYVVEADGNMEFCKSSLKLDKQINFIISYEENKIYLLLIEKIKDKINPEIEEFNEYVLDEYIVNGLVDRNIIYTKWNVKPFGGYVLDIFSCEDEILEKYFGIVSRFKYLLKSNQTLLEEEENLEEVEAEYFNDMMELLKRYPKLYDVVVEKMRAFIEVNEELFDETKPWYISHINQLMNYCIRSSYAVLSEIEKVEFEIEQHQLMVGQSIKKAELLPTDKKDNGAIYLKTSESLKTVSEIGVAYVEAVKQINKVLKLEKETTEDKKTFTKKEMAIIKLEKSGITKAKANSKAKSTLVDNLVKSKTEGKTAVKKAVAKKVVVKAVAKSAAKGGGKSASKPAAKKTAAKKAAGAKKVAPKKDDKKKQEDERKKKLRNLYAISNAQMTLSSATLIQRIQVNVASKTASQYSNPAQVQNQSADSAQTKNPPQQQSAGDGSNSSGNPSATHRVRVISNRFTVQEFQRVYGETNSEIKAGRRTVLTGETNPYKNQKGQNASVAGQESGVGEFGQANKNQEYDINI